MDTTLARILPTRNGNCGTIFRRCMKALRHGSYLQGMETAGSRYGPWGSWKLARILPTRNGNLGPEPNSAPKSGSARILPTRNGNATSPQRLTTLVTHGSYLQGMETHPHKFFACGSQGARILPTRNGNRCSAALAVSWFLARILPTRNGNLPSSPQRRGLIHARILPTRNGNQAGPFSFVYLS